MRQLLGTFRKIGVGGVVFLDGGDVTPTWSELDRSATSTGRRGARACALLTIVGAVRVGLSATA